LLLTALSPSCAEASNAEGPNDRASLCRADHLSARAAQGLSWQVRFVIPGFHKAILTAAASDSVAAVPPGVAAAAVQFGLKVCYVDLPIATPQITIVQARHPRFDKDAGHRWSRNAVRRALADCHVAERM
jgi:DNA-binding transcriptional LysR family regulator